VTPKALDGDRKEMTFLEHLEELRSRLLKSLLSVIAGMLVCWFFREEIRRFLEEPLYTAWRMVPGLPEPTPLSFTSLMEPFMVYLKISAVGGLFLASPVVFYHLWRFISPGLYHRERRLMIPFVMLSSVLFIVGSAGAYRYVFPLGFSFFLTFSAGGTVQEHRETVAAVAPLRPVRKPSSQNGTHATKSKSQKVQAVSSHPSVLTDSTSRAVALYRALETALGKKPCGTFTSTREHRDVRLRYHPNSSRCPEDPTELRLLRNGIDTDLLLTPVFAGPDRLVYETVDENRPLQTAYTLRVIQPPKNRLMPILMVRDYLNFATRLLLAFGLVFELPILLFFLAFAGIADHRQLIRFGRWFVVLSVVLSAILTPPDVLTQILLATPLVLLYYISILLIYLFVPRRAGE
jgi:Tat protein translocase TatC